MEEEKKEIPSPKKTGTKKKKAKARSLKIKYRDEGGPAEVGITSSYLKHKSYYIGNGGSIEGGGKCQIELKDADIDLVQAAFSYKEQSSCFYIQCISSHFFTMYRLPSTQKVRLHQKDFIAIARGDGYAIEEITAHPKDSLPLNMLNYKEHIDLRPEVAVSPCVGHPMLKLVGRTENVQGVPIQFEAPSPQIFTCGRLETCSSVMNSPGVSGLHFTLGYEGGIGWYIIDGVNGKSSTNGTSFAINTADLFNREPSPLVPIIGNMTFEAGVTEFTVYIYIIYIYLYIDFYWR